MATSQFARGAARNVFHNFQLPRWYQRPFRLASQTAHGLLPAERALLGPFLSFQDVRQIRFIGFHREVFLVYQCYYEEATVCFRRPPVEMPYTADQFIDFTDHSWFYRLEHLNLTRVFMSFTRLCLQKIFIAYQSPTSREVWQRKKIHIFLIGKGPNLPQSPKLPVGRDHTNNFFVQLWFVICKVAISSSGVVTSLFIIKQVRCSCLHEISMC